MEWNKAWLEDWPGSRRRVLDALRHDSIPVRERSVAWLRMAGGDQLSSESGVAYEELVEGETPHEEAIRKDINRTFAIFHEIPGFDDVPEALVRGFRRTRPQKADALGRILRAYAVFDREVGYHQGLNFVAAVVLLQVGEEADAFWTLAGLLGRGHRALFRADRPTLRDEIDRFERVMARCLPSLAGHFAAEEFLPIYFSVDWLTTFFTYSLPCSAALWVFDVLIAGLPDALFCVGAGLLAVVDPAVRGLDFASLMRDFKTISRGVDERALREAVWRLAPQCQRAATRQARTLSRTALAADHPPAPLYPAACPATSLALAVREDDLDSLRTLLLSRRYPALVTGPLLHAACIAGSAHATADLLRHGLAPVDWRIDFAALAAPHPDPLRPPPAQRAPADAGGLDRGRDSAAAAALAAASAPLAALLGAAASAPPHPARGLTPLQVAAALDRPAVARVLLAAGAARTGAPEPTRGHVRTHSPLSIARALDHAAAAAVLSGRVCVRCNRWLGWRIRRKVCREPRRMLPVRSAANGGGEAAPSPPSPQPRVAVAVYGGRTVRVPARPAHGSGPGSRARRTGSVPARRGGVSDELAALVGTAKGGGGASAARAPAARAAGTEAPGSARRFAASPPASDGADSVASSAAHGMERDSRPLRRHSGGTPAAGAGGDSNGGEDDGGSLLPPSPVGASSIAAAERSRRSLEAGAAAAAAAQRWGRAASPASVASDAAAGRPRGRASSQEDADIDFSPYDDDDDCADGSASARAGTPRSQRGGSARLVGGGSPGPGGADGSEIDARGARGGERVERSAVAVAALDVERAGFDADGGRRASMTGAALAGTAPLGPPGTRQASAAAAGGGGCGCSFCTGCLLLHSCPAEGVRSPGQRATGVPEWDAQAGVQAGAVAATARDAARRPPADAEWAAWLPSVGAAPAALPGRWLWLAPPDPGARSARPLPGAAAAAEAAAAVVLLPPRGRSVASVGPAPAVDGKGRAAAAGAAKEDWHCGDCGALFGTFERRYACKRCGAALCDACSRAKIYAVPGRSRTVSRACASCRHFTGQCSCPDLPLRPATASDPKQAARARTLAEEGRVLRETAADAHAHAPSRCAHANVDRASCLICECGACAHKAALSVLAAAQWRAGQPPQPTSSASVAAAPAPTPSPSPSPTPARDARGHRPSP